MNPRILVFAGSTRSGAFSGKTADAAVKELALRGAEVTRISLTDYPLPIMNEDLEKEKGVPENAVKLGRMIASHDGLLIASPEYNASIPPLLKNTVDWLSRVSSDGSRKLRPLPGLPVALCSSSDGQFAGVRGLYHLRAVLMNCRCDIITAQCSVPYAQNAFSEDGDFIDKALAGRMQTVCSDLIERARVLSKRVEA